MNITDNLNITITPPPVYKLEIFPPSLLNIGSGNVWAYESLNTDYITVGSGSGYTIKKSLSSIDGSGSINIPSNAFYKKNGVPLSAADVNAETLSNKVTSFQAVPDDIHYPSEKLVYDAILHKISWASGSVTQMNAFAAQLILAGNTDVIIWKNTDPGDRGFYFWRGDIFT